jgi:hypothetical protein
MSIESEAFAYCFSLANLIIPNSVTNVASDAFDSCTNLASVSIPDSVITIGSMAFYHCEGLTNVTLGSGISYLGSRVFNYCTSLINVTIPANVANIYNMAFSDCSNLTSIYFQGDAPGAGIGVFTYDNKATVYYLPGTTGWGATFADRPTALWNPQFKANDSTFGVQNDQFGFKIEGTPNIPLVLEVTEGFNNPKWTTLQNCTLTNGSLYVADADWRNFSSRFYRIRSP